MELYGVPPKIYQNNEECVTNKATGGLGEIRERKNVGIHILLGIELGDKE